MGAAATTLAASDPLDHDASSLELGLGFLSGLVRRADSFPEVVDLDLGDRWFTRLPSAKLTVPFPAFAGCDSLKGSLKFNVNLVLVNVTAPAAAVPAAVTVDGHAVPCFLEDACRLVPANEDVGFP